MVLSLVCCSRASCLRAIYISCFLLHSSFHLPFSTTKMTSSMSVGSNDGALSSPSIRRPITPAGHKNKHTNWQETVTERLPSFNHHVISMEPPQQQVVRPVALPGVADIFSPEIFQIVLHNPTTSHQLLKYSQSRFCGENMEFLDKVPLPFLTNIPTRAKTQLN